MKNVIERLVVTNSGGTVSGHEAMEALHIKQEPPSLTCQGLKQD